MADKRKTARIVDLLSVGADNAVTARMLSVLTGWPPRVVTRQIEAERRAGAPICATCDGTKPGYYLAANAEDVDMYLGRLAHREAEVRRTRLAMAAARAKLPGQTAMTFSGGV